MKRGLMYYYLTSDNNVRFDFVERPLRKYGLVETVPCIRY